MNVADQATTHIDATIPNAGTETEQIVLEQGLIPVGIYHPALTTDVAFFFDVTYDKDVAEVPLEKPSDGTAYSVTIAAAAGYVPLDPAIFRGIQILVIKCTTGQTGAKALKLAVRPVS